jgi:uncharacterized protein involved in exopolysaccharide biosynthesis
MKTGKRRIGGFFLILAGVILTALSLIRLQAPDFYEATTRFHIDRDSNDMRSSLEKSGMYDPYFIQTEFEIIQSELILNEVIEKLNLRLEWGKRYAQGQNLTSSEAIVLLKQRIRFPRPQLPDLVEIRVRSEYPIEAANIANALTEAYRDHRIRLMRDLTESGIKALQERLQEEEKKRELAQADVERLRSEFNVPSPEPEDLSKYPDYSKAKQKLAERNQFFGVVNWKIETEKAMLRSIESPVRILEPATPPSTPAFPNRASASAALFAGFLMIGIGIYLVKTKTFKLPSQ